MHQSLLALYHIHVMYKMHMNTGKTKDYPKPYTKLLFSAKK